MKTMIVTTPIRPKPTAFPPFGSLALIKYLRQNEIKDVEFYNIDALRPDYEAVLEHIKAAKPDVFAISAVVFTAYEYTKRLYKSFARSLTTTLAPYSTMKNLCSPCGVAGSLYL